MNEKSSARVSVDFFFVYSYDAMEFARLLVDTGHRIQVNAAPFPEEGYSVTVFDCRPSVAQEEKR